MEKYVQIVNGELHVTKHSRENLIEIYVHDVLSAKVTFKEAIELSAILKEVVKMSEE